MDIYLNQFDLFWPNKFTTAYFAITGRATNQQRSKRDVVVYECHHIIPKSLGGTDGRENLVLLTPFEHFVCHWLLTKMCKDETHQNKMLYAFRCMANTRECASLKQAAKLHEDLKYKLHHLRPSRETRKRMSDAAKNRVPSFLGKKHSPEARLKISKAFKGKPLDPEHRRKMGEARKGNKNANHTYQVVLPGGETVIVTDRRAFCKEHNLHDVVFGRYMHLQKPYKGYQITRINGSND